MSRKYMSRAIADGLALGLEKDPNVVVFGEDVERSVLGPTKGLVDRFGASRIRNTPISEQAVLGAAAGAALVGIRPVVDLMFGGFLYVAMDQVVNQIAHTCYMSGGRVNVPIVVLAGVGPLGQAGAQHSESPHSTLMHAAGIKVVMPSNPADAQALIQSALLDDNPVAFLMDISLSGMSGEVPDDDYAVPIGKANAIRQGNDLSIVAVGATVRPAVRAAEMLAAEGVHADVIDLRSLVPLDISAVVTSVQKTGRLIVADPGRRTCGAAGEIIVRVVELAWDSLRAAPVRMTWPDVPVPFSPALEYALTVTVEDLADAARKMIASQHSSRSHD